MKTNKMMRLASVLLVAVLLSTCAISGTFAKYTTTETGSDTARVAKWGVVITPNGDMFGKHYYSANDNSVSAAYTGSVDADPSDYENIVAPGTTGTMAKVSISGTPEVRVQVSYAATLTLTGWEYKDGDSNVEYCPIYFTINGKTYGITGNTVNALDHGYATVAELVTGVQNAIAGYSKTYNSNTDLSTIGYEALSVSWAWDFYVSDANDVKDTKLADKTTAPEIEFSVTTTVTQVD